MIALFGFATAAIVTTVAVYVIFEIKGQKKFQENFRKKKCMLK